MKDAELRARCASLAVGGLEQRCGTWTLSETALGRIRDELHHAGALLPRMLDTLGIFAMWIPNHRPGSEPARDALLRLLADWRLKTLAQTTPRVDNIGRFARPTVPPGGSRRAHPGFQFSFADESRGARKI